MIAQDSKLNQCDDYIIRLGYAYYQKYMCIQILQRNAYIIIQKHYNVHAHQIAPVSAPNGCFGRLKRLMWPFQICNNSGQSHLGPRLISNSRSNSEATFPQHQSLRMVPSVPRNEAKMVQLWQTSQFRQLSLLPQSHWQLHDNDWFLVGKYKAMTTATVPASKVVISFAQVAFAPC